MATGKVSLQRIAIYHPRRPYYIEAYRHKSAPDFAIVQLTDGYWRVLHSTTGLTLADTDARWVAIEFVEAMVKEMTYPEFKEAYERLSWDGFVAHVSGDNPDEQVQLLIDRIKRYTKRIGYVGAKKTEGCRYKNTPEYMI